MPNKPEPLIEQVIDKANNLREKGNINFAIELLQKALGKHPENPKLMCLISHCYILEGDLALAEKYLLRASSIDPTNVDLLWNKIRLLIKQKKPKEALSLAITTNEKFMKHWEGLLLLGTSLRINNRHEEAFEIINEVIDINPICAEALINRALIFLVFKEKYNALEDLQRAHQLKPHLEQIWELLIDLQLEFSKFFEAIEVLNFILKKLQNNPKYHFALALCEQNIGNTGNAIQAYKKALSFDPSYYPALNNLGRAYQELGELDQALASYSKAMQVDPESIEARVNLGSVLKNKGQYEEAVSLLLKSLSLEENSAELYNNLGCTYHEMGAPEQAIDAFNKATNIDPNYAQAYENLSFSLLNEDNIHAGLEAYEWRKKTSKFRSKERRFRQLEWDGKCSLENKRVLLWCEQGLGDTINWTRYVNQMSILAKQCIFECHPKLFAIMKRSFPNVNVQLEDRRKDLVRNDFDLHIPMGSLQKLLFSYEHICNFSTAYLFPNPKRVAFWKNRLHSVGAGPFVGISWKSSDLSPERMQNYAKAIDFEPLFRSSKLNFVNLQPTDYIDDLQEIKKTFGCEVYDFSDLDKYNDLDDLAALIKALDFVVATKTLVPMLSSAVGTSTKLANWKQSYWNNILYNPQGPDVTIYERDTNAKWYDIFSLIAKDF